MAASVAPVGTAPPPTRDPLYGTEHVLRRAGYELHFWDGGARVDTALVFSHGMLVGHRFMEAQVRHFAPQYRVVSWDAPGNGLSKPMPHPFRIDVAADDLVAILDKLDLREAILVGVCQGGVISQEVLFRHPERVRALVVLDARCVTTTPGPLDRLQLQMFRAGLISYGLFKRIGMHQMAMAPVTAAHVLQAMAEYTQRDAKESVLGALSYYHEEPGYRVPKPTLLLVGEHNGFMNMPALMRRWAARDPGCGFQVIPGVTHASNFDAPDQVNERIARFVEEVIAGTVPATA